MRKLSVGLFVIVLVLTACGSRPTEQPSYPNPSYPSPSYPNDNSSVTLTPAEQAALTHLSETLGLPVDQISLISTESVTWPDGCLGVQKMGVMCTQAMVEGFRIVFEANGREYEVHTDATGSVAVVAGEADVNDTTSNILIAQLSENLGLDAGTISVVSSKPVEFNDSCMGVSMQDMMCAEVITPGRIVVLEANGIQYEYHISDDGTRIQPATFALTWSREGGFAGFCDRLTVFLSGEIYGDQCKSQPNGTMGTFATLLSSTETDQFSTWFAEFGFVTIDASDPKGVSDRMTRSVTFYGSGNSEPTDAIKSDIFTWAQNVFQKLYN